MKNLALISTAALLVAFAAGCDKDKEKTEGSGTTETTSATEPKAEENKAELPKAEEKAAGASCDAVVPHVINTMVDAQGDQAMLKKDDIPKLTKGCEASKSAETADAKCASEAKSLDDLKKCEGLNKMLKEWMKNAG